METKKYKATKKDWIKFGIVLVLYIAFLAWIEFCSNVGPEIPWFGIIALPFIFDAYITRRINWGWWKDLENPVTRTIMSWVDAIVFALVAVYFVNVYFFQNYTIPSSSLEKSLLTGDYLFVSKLSYGPRVPQTPLHMPLCQHTLPFCNVKSYISWPQWDYKRVSPKRVKQNDIVVFNYPAGDTIFANQECQTAYYEICYSLGEEVYPSVHGISPNPDSLNALQRYEYFQEVYRLGADYARNGLNVNGQKLIDIYGAVGYRPVDRRENYVKRCVGLPGQTLQIKDNVIYINGKMQKQPHDVQFNYNIDLNYDLPDDLVRELGISQEDLITLHNHGVMPLTQASYKALSARKDFVQSISLNKDDSRDIRVYPHDQRWSRDNYGPLWIPEKGKSVDLTLDNLAIYERPIRVYEHNDLKVTPEGKILINGKPATKYTFKMDYYWMMGDNRHNSADSRYWGFVPEDHIEGKPIMIWMSLDPDYGWFDGKIRWSRMFRWVDNIAGIDKK